MSSNLPVLALTFLGILIALLGLFAPAVELIIVGLVSIAAAGVLQVLGSRRS
jgi:hypothetical protein